MIGNKTRSEALAKLYGRNSIYAHCFTWITALQSQGLSITVEQGISNFMKHCDLAEDEINFDSARTTYYRMQKELIELKKTK